MTTQDVHTAALDPATRGVAIYTGMDGSMELTTGPSSCTGPARIQVVRDRLYVLSRPLTSSQSRVHLDRGKLLLQVEEQVENCALSGVTPGFQAAAC